MSMNEFDALSPRTCHQLTVTGDDGVAVSLPVTVLTGHSPRPQVVLMAGVHGDEYDGILALQELARELDPTQVHGVVVVVPVANPFAFAAAQRRTPADNVDLNRVFPGRPNGSVTERLADLLYQRLLRQADLVFTLHGATSSGELAPWIEFLNLPTPLGRITYEAARASGFPDLIALPLLPGTLQTALADDGIPVVEGEVGGRGATRRANVDYYKERARDVLRHARLLNGQPSTGIEIEPRIWALHSVRAGASGLLITEKGLRDDVHAGDRVGTVVDVTGAVVTDVRVTRSGIIGSIREHVGVRPDDTAFIVWMAAEAYVGAAT